ncbi:MAG: lipopolysaccharide biosynthesis protein [Verrucomicrobiota bacterium]
MTERPDKAKLFQTAHLKEDLRGRSIRAGIVTASAQLLKAILGFLNIALLSRLLSAENYGLVAMASAFMGFLWILTEGGLTMASVQSDELDHHKASTIFWVNMLFGTGCGLIFAVLAPFIAWYYRDPRLVAIVLCLAVAFPLKASGMQHQALLTRQMKFSILAMIDIASAALGLIVGVICAFRGLQYWSLIAQTYTTFAVAMVLYWWFSGWRPGFQFSLREVRSILHVGGYYSGFLCVCAFNKSMESLLIGRIGGATQLGLFNRAMSSSMSPFQQFISPVAAVAFPALSRAVTQPAQYRRGVQQICGTLLALSLPAVAFLIPAAQPVIRILLGPNWDAAVPTFAWLLPAAFLDVFNVIGALIFNTTGSTKQFFIFSLFEALVINGSILLAAPYGVTMVAMGLSLSGLLIRTPALLWLAARCGSLPVSDFYRPLIHEAPLAAGVAAAVLFCARALPGWQPVPQIMVMAGAAALVYFSLLALFPFGRRRIALIAEHAEKFLRRSN